MCAENAKKKHRKFAFIRMPAVLFATTMVAISFIIAEDLFARNEGYASDSTSQAAAVNNDCLTPIFDSNTIDNAIV
jgi:hypothetical protein